MKLDSMEKRLGVVLILASIIIFVIVVIGWAISAPQLVAYHMPQGQIVYYKRGYMEASLVQWLQITLIALPMGVCGLAFLFGYGSRLLNWIRNGPAASEEEEKQDDNQQRF